MMRRPARYAVGCVSAALALAFFVVGVPMLLAGLGSPWPVHWSWERFVTDVRVGYVPTSAVVKVALVAGWALWLFLTYEIVAETASWVRRHGSRHSSALGPLQPVLAKLVAAVVLSAPIPGRGIASPTSSGLLSDAVALPAEFILTDGVAIAPSPSVTPDSLPTYVVQPRDTLWGIAERYLGDPLRWSEIAALNKGRPEGLATFGDPDWIYPGWVLVLPPDATDLGVPGSSTASAEIPASQQPPGLLPVASSQAAGGSPAVGNALASGGVGPRGRYRTSVEGAGARPRTSPAGARSAAARASVPVMPIGFGILGAGVVLVLERMRRARQRRQPRSIRITLPEAEIANLERGLRASADNDLVLSLDLGIRLLGTLVDEGICAPPKIVAARCREDALEFVLGDDEFPDPPAPFAAIAPDRTWRLERRWIAQLTSERKRALARADTPVPTLVTLGADELGTVLVDVERMGSLAVVGADTSLVLQGIIVELSTVPWGEGADIVVVGHPTELRGLERVRSAPSLSAILAEMRLRVAQQGRLLEGGSVGTVADGRWGCGGPAWDAVVVVALPTSVQAEPEAALRLAELAGDGDQGLVVLFGSESGITTATRWTATTDQGFVALQRVRTTDRAEGGVQLEADRLGPLTTQTLPTDLLGRVDELFSGETKDAGTTLTSVVHDVATRAPSGPPALSGDRFAPVVRASSSPNGDTEESVMSDGAIEESTRSAPDGEGHEVEVRILGPIAVLGTARPFSRAWTIDLVVYLAVTGEATTEKWSTALWPDQLMAPATLHSTASAARRCLGVSASGEDHLPRSHGRLALGPGVTSDWKQFQRFASVDSPESRRAALRLIRGRPFDGLRSPDWPLLDGHLAAIETVVVDLALRHADWALTGGDPDPATAEWSARQGLRVSPYDERLYRVLLRAADAAGNPAGVEATMRELVQLVADDIEPYDAVHPETLELYRRLSRRPGVRRGA